jgi:hypothetical protein
MQSASLRTEGNVSVVGPINGLGAIHLSANSTLTSDFISISEGKTSFFSFDLFLSLFPSFPLSLFPSLPYPSLFPPSLSLSLPPLFCFNSLYKYYYFSLFSGIRSKDERNRERKRRKGGERRKAKRKKKGEEREEKGGKIL